MSNTAHKYPGVGILRKKLKTLSAGEIAGLLQVHVSHVHNVKRRGVSPTLHRAMVRAGWLKRRPGQVRLAASLTPAQRARLHALAAARGLTWSELCRALADGELALTG